MTTLQDDGSKSTGFASLVVSMLASFFLARLMVRPIRALQDCAAQIAAIRKLR